VVAREGFGRHYMLSLPVSSIEENNTMLKGFLPHNSKVRPKALLCSMYEQDSSMKRNDLSTLAAFLAVAEERCGCCRARRATSRQPRRENGAPAAGSRMSGRTLRLARQARRPRAAARRINNVGPRLAKFTHDYPDIIFDITADDSRMISWPEAVDFVAVENSQLYKEPHISTRNTNPPH